MSELEEVLVSLYASAINVSISWIWDGDIDVLPEKSAKRR
jgi:hypothetical protein